MHGCGERMDEADFDEARIIEHERTNECARIIIGTVILAGVMAMYACFTTWDARINAETESIMHGIDNTYYTAHDGGRVFYREVKDPSVWLMNDGKRMKRPGLLGK